MNDCDNITNVESDEKCKLCGEWFGDHKDDCPNEDQRYVYNITFGITYSMKQTWYDNIPYLQTNIEELKLDE